MAGQGLERREILRYIGIASVAAAFPGFRRWSFACAADHFPPSAANPSPGTYEPLFFKAPHYRLLERLTDIILPADETPGAKDAGVSEFIDFMVANRVPVTPHYDIRSTQDAIVQGTDAQFQFLSGLDWIDARAKSEFSKHFLDCSPPQQTSLLEELAYKSKFTPTTEVGRDFFRMLRDYTVVGYYTSKIGLEALGYPGLRPVWSKMPGCTHLDDPEHLHLPPPAGAAGPKSNAS